MLSISGKDCISKRQSLSLSPNLILNTLLARLGRLSFIYIYIYIYMQYIHTRLQSYPITVRHREMPQRWWTEVKRSFIFWQIRCNSQKNIVVIHSNTNLEGLNPPNRRLPTEYFPHVCLLDILCRMSYFHSDIQHAQVSSCLNAHTCIPSPSLFHFLHHPLILISSFFVWPTTARQRETCC